MDRKRKAKKKKQEKKKKKKENIAARDTNDAAAAAAESALESQGYGVQPLGNLLFSTGKRNIRDAGLGNLQLLSDEIVCDVLGLLSARDLARLGVASKAFYVFSHQDVLWRNLVLQELQGEFVFNESWRGTYICSTRNAAARVPSLKIQDFYSDYLFQSWLCASVELKDEWLSRDNINRRSNLSVEQFVSEFEQANRPVLITDAIDHWPALAKWNKDYLLNLAGDVAFAAGPVDMKLRNYFIYAESAQEERPLYLFDPKFGDKVPQLAADYEVPEYFKEDLFSILGDERPDYRWLILGPARSGSSFHIDPNSTSAWNAVVTGSKKWILYPPDAVPPGVHPSFDGAEVAAPVSITEWFMNFYEQTKHGKHRPVECICRAGEVVFIPNGWWHVVINLEDSIAITQNYVSRSNLLNVLEFMNKPNSQELVSGTTDRVNLHDKFKSRYEELFPGVIEQLRKEKSNRRTSLWESLTRTGSSFQFNFSS